VSYVKIFDSIVASTIWSAPSDHRVVWVTMLAIADRDGYVKASVPGLAHLCRVSRESCEAALASFLAPDPDSRTKAYDGKRIAVAEGGWLLLNYEFYRDMASKEEKLEKDRLRQERKRMRDRDASRFVTDVTIGHATSPKVASHLISSDLTSAQKSTPRAAALGPTDPRFDQFWQAYGRKGSRKQSLAAWVKLKPTDEMAAQVIAAAKAYRAAKAGDPKFQRDGQRWLRDEGWNDEVMPGSSPTPLKVTASGRVVVEASKMHIPNMPLGSEFCDCPGCAAAKLTRSLSDAKNVSNHVRGAS